MATPFTKIVQLTAANALRDGTGTIVDVHSGNSSGRTRFDRIRVQATGPTTVGFIHAYLKKSGGSYRFVREWAVKAVTAQNITDGIPRWFVDIDCTVNYEAFYLQNGDILALATDKAETFNVLAMGGDA